MRPTGIIIGFCCAVLAGLTFTSANAADKQDPEYAKVCEAAERRYQKVFGKPSKDEDVTIVKMYKYRFCPNELSVKQGETIRWVNVDKRTSHSIWFKEQGKTESDRVFGEEHFEWKVDLPPGIQPYICGPHFERDNMSARITIVP